MITQLYNFSVGSFVVAEEWNANFRVLKDYCDAHSIAINDAYQIFAFPDSDLSVVFNAVRAYPNVKTNMAYISFLVDNNNEYYVGNLPPQQPVNIVIKEGLNGECRIIFDLPELMTLEPPIAIWYKGVRITPGDNTEDCYVNVGAYDYYNPGKYYVFVHEQNGKAQVKLVSTVEE